MINNPEGKQFIRELTLEYIRQNDLLHCQHADIPKIVDSIVDVENIISDSVEKRWKDFKSFQNYDNLLPNT